MKHHHIIKSNSRYFKKLLRFLIVLFITFSQSVIQAQQVDKITQFMSSLYYSLPSCKSTLEIVEKINDESSLEKANVHLFGISTLILDNPYLEISSHAELLIITNENDTPLTFKIILREQLNNSNAQTLANILRSLGSIHKYETNNLTQGEMELFWINGRKKAFCVIETNKDPLSGNSQVTIAYLPKNILSG